jgi:hypothetical protein
MEECDLMRGSRELEAQARAIEQLYGIPLIRLSIAASIDPPGAQIAMSFEPGDRQGL